MVFATGITQEQLVACRRLLHRHAESGFSEFWTTAFLARELANAGLEVQVGESILDREHRMGVPDDTAQSGRLTRALEQGADPGWIRRMNGLTGVVVDLKPGLPPHTVLRFDIDAVDVQESDENAHRPTREGFRSLNDGHCHACGHDGHATVGLGVARTLAPLRDRLRHNVRLVFQPAEEGSRGAAAMVRAGVVDGAKYFFGAHIGGNATQDHQLVCGTRDFLATTKFDVDFQGLAAHSGSEPHKGRNSILAAANAILNLHAISRHGEGDTRIAVGQVVGGTGRNVVPDHAHLVCETRGRTTELDRYMFDRARQIVAGSAAMYEQEYTITLMGQAGSADSDDAMCRIVAEAGAQISYFAPEQLVLKGKGFGSDDACTLLSAVQSRGGIGAYAQIGSALPAGHHHPRFDFNENLLLPAVELFCRVALALDEQG